MATVGMQPSPATDYTGLYEGLKVVFEEPIGNSLVEDQEAYDIFEQDMGIPVSQTGGGRYIELAHYAADAGGFGARREGAPLPEATSPSIFNGRVNLRKNQMTVQMSGETMRRVQQGPSAWLTWAKDALPNAVRRFKAHLDREALGYAQGVMGKVAAIAGNVITVDSAFGLATLDNAIFQFMRNDLIRFAADINGVTLRGAAASKIVSVDPKASKFTVDAVPAGLVVGDFIAIGDSADNSFPGAVGAAPKEMMGLLGMVDDGSVLPTFQNQDRATTMEYQAIVVDAATESAGKFVEDLLIAADDDAFQIGAGQPDIILGSRAAERQYWKNLKQSGTFNDRRGIENTGGKGRGFKINLNGREVMFRVARKIPTQLAFLLEKGTFKKWQVGSGFSFDNTTGSVFERVVTGNARYDAFYAVGNLEAELGNTNPRHNVVIKNIDVTA